MPSGGTHAATTRAIENDHSGFVVSSLRCDRRHDRHRCVDACRVVEARAAGIPLDSHRSEPGRFPNRTGTPAARGLSAYAQNEGKAVKTEQRACFGMFYM